MIPIRNTYYMLAYAFQVLRQQGYRDIATEEFASTAELLAEILIRGVRSQLKRGLGRSYVDVTEPLSSLRGKIEVTESLKTRSILRRQLVCNYDEFSLDTPMNQIIKATCTALIRSRISRPRKKELRRFLPFFAEVSDIELGATNWRMRFDRNNQTYRMMINVCWLIYSGLLHTNEGGETRLAEFLDEQNMCRLYEKFILEYYRQEHPEIQASAPHIAWALDDGFDDMLPTMRSDVTLRRGDTVLIIDAKYYAHATQERFGTRSLHSGNLYQIFTYVKNMEASHSSRAHRVSGMLLYAKTDEEIYPDGAYQMSGNAITVRTLDLNRPFEEIRAQLDGIVEAHFSR